MKNVVNITPEETKKNEVRTVTSSFEIDLIENADFSEFNSVEDLKPHQPSSLPLHKEQTWHP